MGREGSDRNYPDSELSEAEQQAMAEGILNNGQVIDNNTPWQVIDLVVSKGSGKTIFVDSDETGGRCSERQELKGYNNVAFVTK